MSDSSSILLLSIASLFIVISLVLVIIVFRVVRVTPQNQSNFSNRRVFQVTSQNDLHTYCEIGETREEQTSTYQLNLEITNQLTNCMMQQNTQSYLQRILKKYYFDIDNAECS